MSVARLTRAERQAKTRAELVDTAERLFIAQGFRDTTLDEISDAAGYTKGAVYSNFASKEDVFFAVYERRVERFVAHAEATIDAAAATEEGVLEVIAQAGRRREHEDGWLATFLEFWTHVLRHPEYRARFAALHARAAEPFVRAFERVAAEDGLELPMPARALTVAGFAMGTGIGLERLTQPDVVDAELGVRVQRLWVDAIRQGGRS